MYDAQPKKMAIFYILKILKKYTDGDHTLTQKQILDRLKKDYDMTLDRKAVKRNLTDLIDLDYDISYSEKTRITKDGEDETVLTDWYLNRDFTDAELRLLIDSVLFSKYIPCNQCKKLIEKLEAQSNDYFSAKVRHICNLPVSSPANPELFYTIEVLDEAIEKGRQVKFKYTDFNLKLKRIPRKTHDGAEAEYIMNPYQMVATNGRYYLICNLDKYDNVSHYRVDRISGIKMLDTPVKPKKEVKGLENGLDLPKHMAEHIYMYCGKSVNVKFRASKGIISDIVDWFGTLVKFTNETADTVDVSVTVNENAMFNWAMQYGCHVEVLEPQSLRDAIAAAVKDMNDKYN